MPFSMQRKMRIQAASRHRARGHCTGPGSPRPELCVTPRTCSLQCGDMGQQAGGRGAPLSPPQCPHSPLRHSQSLWHHRPLPAGAQPRPPRPGEMESGPDPETRAEGGTHQWCHVGTYFQKTSLALARPALPDVFCNTQPQQATVTAPATGPDVLPGPGPSPSLTLLFCCKQSFSQQKPLSPVLMRCPAQQHPTPGPDPATLPARGPPTWQRSSFLGASQDQGRGLWKEEPR